jgi:5-methylthioribose kinase
MTTTSIREAFTVTHGDVRLLDARDPHGVSEYLVAHGLAVRSDLPASIERAGEGNMNLTLRVRLRDRSIIVKQGRPWVEKYDHIAAPWERTLVEAEFYRTIADIFDVARRMPQLLYVDEDNHVLVLEDLGTVGDFTGVYAGGLLDDRDLQELLHWLSSLDTARPPADGPGILANRAMRRLNHEHIFSLPLREQNGLDLDRITEGLTRAAEPLKSDRDYVWRVAELGEVYLADGGGLVHGDYFPGSWMHSADGVRIIDPEFCFFGAREFDYGVMLAHCALALTAAGAGHQIVEAAGQAGIDMSVLFGFAGTEIMRRLIGVAQLPLPYGLDEKCQLLEASVAFVVRPERGLASWPEA